MGELVGNRESILRQENELGLRGGESKIQAAISEVEREMALCIW